jgi:hypothetical protein
MRFRIQRKREVRMGGILLYGISPFDMLAREKGRFSLFCKVKRTLK